MKRIFCKYVLRICYFIINILGYYLIVFYCVNFNLKNFFSELVYIRRNILLYFSFYREIFLNNFI